MSCDVDIHVVLVSDCVSDRKLDLFILDINSRYFIKNKKKK